MLLADIRFYPAAASSDEEFMDAAEGFLWALEKNGQINGDFVIGWTADHLRATVYAAAEGALQAATNSKWVESALATLLQRSARPPTFDVVDVRKRRTRWDDAGALYLYTHGLTRAPPVCAGDDGSPIPSYVLPISEQVREALVRWADAYRDHDMIALDCRDLEIAAYRQLAELESGLSRRGREICQAIEAATQLPTYYYLQRYWGYLGSEREASRLCPGCGAPWNQNGQLGQIPRKGRGLTAFDFLCMPCRLVSDAAVSFDSKSLARIGEFPGRAKSDKG